MSGAAPASATIKAYIKSLEFSGPEPEPKSAAYSNVKIKYAPPEKREPAAVHIDSTVYLPNSFYEPGQRHLPMSAEENPEHLLLAFIKRERNPGWTLWTDALPFLQAEQELGLLIFAIAAKLALDGAEKEYYVGRMVKKIEGTDLFTFLATDEGDGFRAKTTVELPLENRIEVARACLETLVNFHDHRYQHYDLKPENIMISEKDGHYTITFIDLETASKTAHDHADGIGTAHFLSPEAIRAKASHTGFTDLQQSRKSIDVYAMAVILIEILFIRLSDLLRDSSDHILHNAAEKYMTIQQYKKERKIPNDDPFRLDDERGNRFFREMICGMSKEDIRLRITSHEALAKFNEIFPKELTHAPTHVATAVVTGGAGMATPLFDHFSDMVSGLTLTPPPPPPPVRPY